MTCFCWHKLTEVRDNRRSARMLIVRSMALVPFGGCAYDYPVGGPLSNKVQAWFVDAETCTLGRSERQRPIVGSLQQGNRSLANLTAVPRPQFSTALSRHRYVDVVASG